MSVLDMVSGLLGKDHQLKGFVDGIGNFLNQNGGLEGLRAKLEQGGAGNLVKSWISTGPNLPISQEQIQKVLGNEFVQSMAQKMGVDPATAGQKLAELVPNFVDKLTPNGQMPASLDPKSLLSAASQLFTKKS